MHTHTPHTHLLHTHYTPHVIELFVSRSTIGILQPIPIQCLHLHHEPKTNKKHKLTLGVNNNEFMAHSLRLAPNIAIHLVNAYGPASVPYSLSSTKGSEDYTVPHISPGQKRCK